MVDSDPEFVSSYRDYVATTLGTASGILQSALRGWLAKTIAQLVVEQPLAVMALEPAALSALKLEYGRACDETLANAESMIKDLDLPRAAREALGYPTDERLLDFETRVNQLLVRPIEVLTGGGFKVGVQDIQKGKVPILLSFSVEMALKRYGRQVLDLRAVSADETKGAKDRA